MASRRGRTFSAAQRTQWASDRQPKLADLHQRIVTEVATLTDGAQWRRWLNFAANACNRDRGGGLAAGGARCRGHGFGSAVMTKRLPVRPDRVLGSPRVEACPPDPGFAATKAVRRRGRQLGGRGFIGT